MVKLRVEGGGGWLRERDEKRRREIVENSRRSARE